MTAPKLGVKWWWNKTQALKQAAKQAGVVKWTTNGKPFFQKKAQRSPLLMRMVEQAAWHYEAEKRVIGKYRFDVPFSKLNQEQIAKTVVIWGGRGHASEPTILVMADDQVVPKNNDSKRWLFRLALTLDCADGVIYDQLKKLLKVERDKRGIPAPHAGPKPGSKGQPWKQIEAWDRGSNSKSMRNLWVKYCKKTTEKNRPALFWKIYPNGKWGDPTSKNRK